MATLQPVMQPISVPGQISGTAIINDILRRIRERLEASNSLRSVDGYQGFSFVAEVQLQLHDVDRVEVAASVKAGMIDPGKPVQRVTLQDDVAAEAGENLEKPVDPAGVAETQGQQLRPRDAASGRFSEVSSRAVSRK